MVFIVHPSVDEDGLVAVIDKGKALIERDGGKIDAVEPWGSRRLAYPIQKLWDGKYVLVRFDIPGEQIASLERDLGLTEEIMRHLIVRPEEAPKAKPADG